MVNVLNVYDSMYGNTREVAEIIDKTLKKDHAVITADISKIPDKLITKADVFIIGSPIHYWKPTKKVNTFIMRLFRLKPLNRIGIVYDTRLEKIVTGNAAVKMHKMLSSLRFSMMGRGEFFYVESFKGPLKLGEVDRGERFADRISGFLGNIHTEESHTPGFVL